MNKTLLLVFGLLALVSAFKIQVPKIALYTKEKTSLSAIPWPFTVCGSGDWKIEGLSLDQTPKRNINDNIVVTGTANKRVAFKRADLNVKLNGAFLDKQTAPFANSFESGDSIEFTYKNFIPSFAPAGTYTLTFQFIDSNDKPNGCIEFQFKL